MVCFQTDSVNAGYNQHHPGAPASTDPDAAWRPQNTEPSSDSYTQQTGTGSAWPDENRPSTMGEENTSAWPQQQPSIRSVPPQMDEHRAAFAANDAAWQQQQEKFENTSQPEQRASGGYETGYDQQDPAAQRQPSHRPIQRGSSGRVSWEEDKRDHEERIQRQKERENAAEEMARYRGKSYDKNPYHEGY